MTRRLALILMVFWLAGCREQGPDLRIAQKTGDSVESEPTVIKQIGENVKIVTGEPAIAEDKSEENTLPLEDKPGAVAVKMEY